MQEVLLKLEADIAALPMGQDGFTAPGVFMFELLAKVNLKEETFGFMLQLLDQAMSLLSDEALAAGRKYTCCSCLILLLTGRLPWKDQTCPSDTQPTMSWTAITC